MTSTFIVESISASARKNNLLRIFLINNWAAAFAAARDAVGSDSIQTSYVTLEERCIDEINITIAVDVAANNNILGYFFSAKAIAHQIEYIRKVDITVTVYIDQMGARTIYKDDLLAVPDAEPRYEAAIRIFRIDRN